jgi:hypothetical protein
VFSLADIKELRKQYVEVHLYTDTIPTRFRPSQPADWNQAFQEKAFGNIQLPLYIILEPLPGNDARIVGIYKEGKINDVEAFKTFLKKGLTARPGKTIVLPPAAAK